MSLSDPQLKIQNWMNRIIKKGMMNTCVHLPKRIAMLLRIDYRCVHVSSDRAIRSESDSILWQEPCDSAT
jgi:hypothetical protein